MGFKCSVFGHAFGDAEVEREREEDGKEVVTTIREKQTCERCGETRVVSENKEVTTLETAADIVAEDLEAGDESESVADASPDTGTVEPTDPPEDAEILDDEGDDATIVDDESNDAAIVDAEDDGAAVEAADDPTVADSEADAQPAATIPDAESGDNVADAAGVDQADAEADDGVILEDEEDEPKSEREPGEWPEEPDDDEDDWEPSTEPAFEEEGTTIEQTSTAVTVPEGEFQCPECSFTTPVEASSLREGDFCPECHRGSLEHVADSETES